MRSPDEKAECRLVYERVHILALLQRESGYKYARAGVASVLEGTMRGPSLAECVNPWLRPNAEFMKGIKEQLLPLFVLHRNSYVFEFRIKLLTFSNPFCMAVAGGIIWGTILICMVNSPEPSVEAIGRRVVYYYQ